MVMLITVTRAMPQPGPSDIQHTKWRLVEMKGGQAVVPSETTFTLLVEGSLYHFSGCNMSSGKLRIQHETLILTKPARSTRKACSGNVEAVDGAFTRLAAGAPQYHIETNRLTLTAEGANIWVFQKEPLPSKTAKTKFIYVSAFTKDCTGMVRAKCLQVRESKNRPWSVEYSGIVGFEHVPGIEYRLRIKEDRVAHPMPDAPSLIWYLDAVIEQTVVDRTAADEYLDAKKISR